MIVLPVAVVVQTLTALTLWLVMAVTVAMVLRHQLPERLFIMAAAVVVVIMQAQMEALAVLVVVVLAA